MFKGHPKGLYVLGLSNLGERFGYYTMLAIFTLYLQDHFGWSKGEAATLYGIFLAGVYFFPFFGGLLADKALGYGKTIIIGIIVMIAGYVTMAIPTPTPWLVFIGCFVICVGVGLFKGNMAVLVGNLYDKSSGSLKDAAFNFYYMGINVGAFFAPYAADSAQQYFLNQAGFAYKSDIPQLAHEFLKGAQSDFSSLIEFAKSFGYTDITLFSQKYITALSDGYNAAFAFAVLSLLVSIAIFLIFKKHFKDADYSSRDKVSAERNIQLTPAQTRDRVIALLAVFGIVIFFWMTFHQNGSSLTFFAKNYTDLAVGKITYLWFNLLSLLSVFSIILGLMTVFNKNNKIMGKMIGGIFTIAGIIVLVLFYNSLPDKSNITPQLFQAFNPLFIVFMTPIVVAFFAWLNRRSKEPTAPGKIGIGMFITACAMAIMLIGSLGLESVTSLGVRSSSLLISPYWLISTYFVLTIAELFLSPMGLSFVAKVAPPNMKGLMQGGWLAATGAGNMLAGLIGNLYESWELWQFFLLLVAATLFSSLLVLVVLKKLKRAITS